MDATAEEISLNLIQIFPAVRVRPLLQDGNVSLRSLNGEVQILQMSPGAGVGGVRGVEGRNGVGG